MNKNGFKELMIFIGGVIVLISTVIPAVLAANKITSIGGGENLALLASVTAGSIYMIIMAHLYGRFVIYPNEVTN